MRRRPGGPVRALLLLGPTASGKSALAMALAEHHPVEIISVDSAQVYRGLDIGTAKPDAADRARVPHHLIDIRDPEDPNNAACFVDDANRLIAEIGGRGRLPLLVGGTMLYARALLQPFDALPPADPALRAALDAEAARLGWPALHARLAALDAATAARLEATDAQRIQRALEVIAITGRPLSELHSATSGRPGSDRGPAPRSPRMPADPSRPIISLEPSDRAVLHRRIALRFDAMLAAGFVDEVRALRTRPGLSAALPSMRSVGYRQAWAMLAGELPAADLREAGIAATRQLAKRQITWLRSLPAHARLDSLAPGLVAKASAIIDSLIRR
ncbi:MAG: tRNA (adenosine(37)-N6)-dimethylallyltransferase MiaA [Lautropia sp.]